MTQRVSQSVVSKIQPELAQPPFPSQAKGTPPISSIKPSEKEGRGNHPVDKAIFQAQTLKTEYFSPETTDTRRHEIEKEVCSLFYGLTNISREFAIFLIESHLRSQENAQAALFDPDFDPREHGNYAVLWAVKTGQTELAEILRANILLRNQQDYALSENSHDSSHQIQR